MPKILIFENDPMVANDIKRTLQQDGMGDVTICVTPAALPEREEDWAEYDLAIVDLMMGDRCLPESWRQFTSNGDLTGWVAFDRLCTKKDLPIVILTGLGNEDKLRALQESPSWHEKSKVLRKPLQMKRLISSRSEE